jgi:hypothetical protein
VTTKITRRAFFMTTSASMVFAASGCGDSKKSLVSGTVSVDGDPLANGTIAFFPIDGKGPTAGAGIKDGKYEVEAGVGEMKVTINATKVVGQRKAYDTPDSPKIDIIQEILGPEYHSQSKLTATLKSGKNENVNFELKSNIKKK